MKFQAEIFRRELACLGRQVMPYILLIGPGSAAVPV